MPASSARLGAVDIDDGTQVGDEFGVLDALDGGEQGLALFAAAHQGDLEVAPGLAVGPGRARRRTEKRIRRGGEGFGAERHGPGEGR